MQGSLIREQSRTEKAIEGLVAKMCAGNKPRTNLRSVGRRVLAASRQAESLPGWTPERPACKESLGKCELAQELEHLPEGRRGMAWPREVGRNGLPDRGEPLIGAQQAFRQPELPEQQLTSYDVLMPVWQDFCERPESADLAPGALDEPFGRPGSLSLDPVHAPDRVWHADHTSNTGAMNHEGPVAHGERSQRRCASIQNGSTYHVGTGVWRPYGQQVLQAHVARWLGMTEQCYLGAIRRKDLCRVRACRDIRELPEHAGLGL